jgi:hypothetical protein
MWTRFMDMASGGSCKVKIDGIKKEYIYIELPYKQAVALFESKFDRDPNNVTCDCCGGDYSINEYGSLEEASKYDRQDWHTKGYVSVEEYCQRNDVLIISKFAISSDNGSPGTFGYFSMRD